MMHFTDDRLQMAGVEPLLQALSQTCRSVPEPPAAFRSFSAKTKKNNDGTIVASERAIMRIARLKCGAAAQIKLCWPELMLTSATFLKWRFLVTISPFGPFTDLFLTSYPPVRLGVCWADAFQMCPLFFKTKDKQNKNLCFDLEKQCTCDAFETTLIIHGGCFRGGPRGQLVCRHRCYTQVIGSYKTGTFGLAVMWGKGPAHFRSICEIVYCSFVSAGVCTNVSSLWWSAAGVTGSQGPRRHHQSSTSEVNIICTMWDKPTT